MNVRTLVNLFKTNAPAIMTTLGMVGTFTSAYLAHTATRRAIQDLGLDHSYKESWRYYILPLSVAAVSAGCVFGAHQVSTRQIAAAGAVALAAEQGKKLLERAVAEEFGDAGLKQAQSRSSEMRVLQDPPPREFINTIPDSEILVLESYSGRYFKSTAEAIRRAEKDMAEIIWTQDYASLNTWYSLLEIDATVMGDDLGWNQSCEFNLIEDSALTSGNTPVLVLRYSNNPYDRYDRVH